MDLTSQHALPLSPSRRRAVQALLGAGLAAAGWRPAWSADDYPVRPIKLVVAYGAGGANDIIARIIAKPLAESLGQSVVVFNQPGAGGTVGAAEVARAQPDGYTLLMAAGAHALAPSLYSKLPYDINKDFVPIGMAGRGTYVLCTNLSLPVKSVSELTVYAKTDGRQLSFVSSGVGAPPHLAGAVYKSMIGASMVHVPYKAEQESLTDLTTGRADIGFITMSNAAPLIKAGRLRGLAVTSATRSSILPDMPTMAEAGVPGFDVGTWWGVMAPARTPPAIVNKLFAALAKSVAAPSYASLLAVQGMDVAASRSPEEFAAYVQSERERYGAIVKAAGVQAE